jgi:uncharacterized protein YuzE
MNLSIESNQETGDVLAVYITLGEGAVARTIEIEEAACYADEDSEGNLLGLEILAPVDAGLLVDCVTRRYGLSGISTAMKKASEALAV